MKEIQQEITPITNEDLFIILHHPNAHFRSTAIRNTRSIW